MQAIYNQQWRQQNWCVHERVSATLSGWGLLAAAVWPREQPQTEWTTPARLSDQFSANSNRMVQRVGGNKLSDVLYWCTVCQITWIWHIPKVTLTCIAITLHVLTVIEDSVTLRSRDLALLILAKVELDTSGTERSFPASRDISYKSNIRVKLKLYSILAVLYIQTVQVLYIWRTTHMLISQNAPLAAPLTLDWCGIGRGLTGAAGVHVVCLLTLLKSRNDLRTPKRHNRKSHLIPQPNCISSNITGILIHFVS